MTMLSNDEMMVMHVPVSNQFFSGIPSNSALSQVLVWVLWATAFTMTAFRGGMQWYLQRKFYADDYLVLFGMASLTALSAAISKLLPQFYLSGDYVRAAALNPLTPLPLPQDEFLTRTITSLKFMFRYASLDTGTSRTSLMNLDSQMLLFWTTLWAGRYRHYNYMNYALIKAIS
jgi:hypothetical protein